jgi:anti-sigma B factor antagonist
MTACPQQSEADFPSFSSFEPICSRHRDTQFIVVTGELDLARAEELGLAVEVADATSAKTIVLDLRRLEFIDSSGIHAIVAARERLGERLIVVRGSRSVHRVFELWGLVERVAFVDALAERADPDAATWSGMDARPGAAPGPQRAARVDRDRRASQGLLAAAIRELRSGSTDPVA